MIINRYDGTTCEIKIVELNELYWLMYSGGGVYRNIAGSEYHVVNDCVDKMLQIAKDLESGTLVNLEINMAA